MITINWDIIPGIEKKGFSSLPLFYGMCYDGCTMTYEIEVSSRLRLLELEPRMSTDDWPYSGYPDLLPYVPLRLAQRVPCSPEQFQDLLIQGDDVNPDQVTVIVPPMFDLGLSMWGHSGDGEGVQIVFQCDVRARTVRAFNECT